MGALSVLTPVNAVYEDEAGVNDWYLQQLGFLTNSPAPGIYYSQSTGALAKLNETDGSIVWRQFLSTEHTGNDNSTSPIFHHISKSNYLVVGSSSLSSTEESDESLNSCKISVFDLLTSSKQWELTVSGKCIGFTGYPDIYALTSAAFYSIDSQTGSLITKPLIPELLHTPFEFLSISSNGVVLGDSATGSILEYEFPKNHDSASASPSPSSSEDSANVDPFANAPVVLGPGTFIDYNFGVLVWAEETRDRNSLVTVRVGAFELLTKSIGELPLIKVVSPSAVIVQDKNTLSVYSVTKIGVKLEYTTHKVESFSILDSYKFVILNTDQNISIMNIKSGASVFSRHLSASPSLVSGYFVQYPNGVVEPINFSKSGNTANTVSWSRDESLAHLAGSALIDFPDSSNLSFDLNEAIREESTDIVSAYIDRTARHITDLVSFFKSGFFSPSNLVQVVVSFFQPPSELAQQKANVYFGLRKYFVAVSKTGRVQALDSSLGGKSAWARDVFPAVDGLYDFQVTNIDNIIYIINNADGTVVGVDGLTGSTVSNSSIPNIGNDNDDIVKIVDMYFSRSETDAEELGSIDVTDEKVKTPVVWTSSNLLYKLDGTPFIPKSDVFISRISKDKKSVVGYIVFGQSSSSEIPAGTIQVVWTHNAPANHKVHSVTARSPLDRTVNVGRVLGNRSVLYKYLHSNLIAILSTAPGKINVSLIDSVTGRILYSEHHETGLEKAASIDVQSVDKNTHIVVGESWVVYTFWSAKPTLGQVIVVCDLFESGVANVHWMTNESREIVEAEKEKEREEKEKSIFERVGNGEGEDEGTEEGENEKSANTAQSKLSTKENKNEESSKKPKKPISKSKAAPEHYSSFSDYDAPDVKSQAYFVPTQFSGITSMSITRTRFGVSVRDVLVSTSRGQIFSLAKRVGYLDGRRPSDRALTNDEKAEGLAEYSEVLPYQADFMSLAHNFYVAGIQKIDVVPSILESTSVVVAHGLDIFATKVAPSLQFDVLSPSFGKDKLAYIILGMLGLVWYLKPMVDRKKTDNLWK